MAIEFATLDLSPFKLADYAGVALFATTGALAAARRGHDIVTFGFFAVVTGVGGGTMRDVILDVPVFWIGDSGYLAVSLAAAMLVWLTGTGSAARFRALLWLDAFGLAAYTVLGAAKALALGAPPLVCVVMGVMTATFGGIVRDVIAGEPSVLLTREVYVTAAVAGAIVFVALALMGLAEPLPAVLAALVAFGIRAGALAFGWSLPGYRTRSGRERS